MTQGLLLWSPCQHLLFLRTPPPFSTHGIKLSPLSVSATLESTTNTSQEELSARERRRLRNERRESKAGTNWREEVEERLLKKPKKRYKSWTEELNLDTLAHLGPQWWVVRVSRIRGQETAELIARLLARNFPQNDFKVIPSFTLFRFPAFVFWVCRQILSLVMNFGLEYNIKVLIITDPESLSY